VIEVMEKDDTSLFIIKDEGGRLLKEGEKRRFLACIGGEERRKGRSGTTSLSAEKG